MPMDIAFFGSSLVSAYWNGAATYYRGIIRALAARGHQITFYEPDAYQRQEHRDIPDPPWCRVVVYPNSRDHALHCIEQARTADLVVKASGVGVFDELLETAVLSLKRHNNLVCFWDVDAPATLDRASHDGDYFRPLIPQYDLVLTYGGGPPVQQKYQSMGARQCVPIYNALDPQTHHPVAPDPRFQADLALCANRLPDREARVEEFFLRPAAEARELRFLLGGSGWGDRPMSPNVTYAGHVYTADHNAFNCTPRAVLNVNRDSMASYGYSPPTRVFEAAGAGACLITDRWVGLDLFLDEDSEVLVAADSDQVVEHLRRLSDKRARRIGDTARRRILAQHTYDHRARLFADVISGRYNQRRQRAITGSHPGDTAPPDKPHRREQPRHEPAEQSRYAS